MKFTETYKGVWESDKQQIVAAIIVRETGNALKDTEPMFRIVEGDKGFKIYRTLFGGRRQYLKTKKTMSEAVRFAEHEVQ